MSTLERNYLKVQIREHFTTKRIRNNRNRYLKSALLSLIVAPKPFHQKYYIFIL